MTRTIRSLLAASALIAAVSTLGCGAGITVGYRAYDPYHADYHVWDANEGVFYSQWTVETHRDPHRDYRKLRRNDQEEYWKWRHDHSDRH